MKREWDKIPKWDDGYIDPKIRDLVTIFNNRGIKTTTSCQGHRRTRGDKSNILHEIPYMGIEEESFYKTRRRLLKFTKKIGKTRRLRMSLLLHYFWSHCTKNQSPRTWLCLMLPTRKSLPEITELARRYL